MPSRRSSSYSASYSARGRSGYRPPGPADRRSLSVLLVLLGAMAALVAFGWLQNRTVALPGGVGVTVVAGTVAVERAEGGEALPYHARAPLTAGQQVPIRAGDALRVSGDGRAVLTLARSSTVELGPGAHVALLEWAQRPVTGSVRARLALHAGAALARLGALSAAGLVVETTAITVESSGGVVLCHALANDHAQVAVYEGSADVSMGEQAAHLRAGEGIDARLGQPLAPVAVLDPAPTPAVVPRETGVAPTATLTDREKTLFPRVLTPTRPGDPPVASEDASHDDGATVWYTVAEGDTLYSIARQHGVSWEAVWEANREALLKPEMLQVGQRLRIPKP